MRRILYGLIITTTLLPATLKAQEATVLTLQDAMNYAVKNNDSVKNARLDVLIQEAKNAEITGIALPNVSAKGRIYGIPAPNSILYSGRFFWTAGNIYSSTVYTQILFNCFCNCIANYCLMVVYW